MEHVAVAGAPHGTRDSSPVCVCDCVRAFVCVCVNATNHPLTLLRVGTTARSCGAREEAGAGGGGT